MQSGNSSDDGIRVSESGANIIFIEKRLPFPANLRRRQAKVPDSCWHERKALWCPPDIERETRDEGGLPPYDFSVGPAMFFSRRWMLCSGSEIRDHRLNCYEKYIKSAKLPDEVINKKLLFKRLHGRVFRDMYEFKVHELGKIAHHLGGDV